MAAYFVCSSSGTFAVTIAPPRRTASAYNSAFSLLVPDSTSAPIKPPATPPPTAPAAKAASQPAATTGPMPGIAIKPRPVAGEGNQAQARRNARCAAGRSAYTASRGGAFGAVVLSIPILVMLGIDI